jgi:hypothetical protein
MRGMRRLGTEKFSGRFVDEGIHRFAGDFASGPEDEATIFQVKRGANYRNGTTQRLSRDIPQLRLIQRAAPR